MSETDIDSDLPRSLEALQAENAELHRRVEEAEDMYHAVRAGSIDAFVVGDGGGRRVYTLEGADRPYRILVEHMFQGAATLHEDGAVAYGNRSLADMLKIPHSKLLGAKFESFFLPEERHVYDTLLWQGRISAGRGEARLRRSDGGLVPVFLTFNTLPPASGAAMCVLTTDLTTQKHHEQLTAAHVALRRSDERSRALFNAIGAGIGVMTTDGAFTDCNDALCALMGRLRSELCKTGFLELSHPDDRPLAAEALEALAGGRMKSRELETRYLRRDGAPLPARSTVSVAAMAGSSTQLVVLVSPVSGAGPVAG